MRVAHMRWRIERDHQDLKQHQGLGHYEGRGRPGFYHHASLRIAVYGFLMAQRHVANSITTLRLQLSVVLASVLGHCPPCHSINLRLNL